MTTKTFSELKLSDTVLRALTEMGFEEPTSIQEQCIPPIMEGRDLVGQAQTGTGKTAAFGIPIVEKIQTGDPSVQVLIQCPTRELAIQVTGELMKLGQCIKNLHVVPVYGGQSIGHQFKALKRGAQVVVGTPGRTIDHLKRGTLRIDRLQMLVFDEADEMLNMGFREDMETILSFTERSMQTVMFSATVPKAIREIMKRYMNDPISITVDREKITVPAIQQYVMEVRDSVRTEAICRLMDVNNYELALVFCNTKRKTEKLTRELQAHGYASDVINGDLSQNQRDSVMNKFRKGRIDILVATDVAARGIDVDNIDVVFNYDIPQDPEYYVHRIGRTGRAGRSGAAITFTSGRKNKGLRYIEKQIKQRLQSLSMPSTEQVQESKMEGQLKDLIDTLEQGGLRPWIEQIEAISDNRFTPTEIAAALFKMKVEAKEKRSKSNGKAPAGSFSDDAMVRLHFDVGRKNNIYPGDLVGAIAGETGIPGNVIGNIDIHGKHSFVDIPGRYVPAVLEGMTNNQVKGRKVRPKVA